MYTFCMFCYDVQRISKYIQDQFYTYFCILTFCDLSSITKRPFPFNKPSQGFPVNQTTVTK